MAKGAKTIIYPVTDIAKAKTLFARLTGVAPEMDQPYYVQFNVDGQQIGLDPNGHAQGFNGPVTYWHVADVRKTVAALLDAGALPHGEIKDVGGGKLIATVKDADGNIIGLQQNPTH
jgi:predicted enzyme related to lactoylglutathione lyase